MPTPTDRTPSTFSMSFDSQGGTSWRRLEPQMVVSRLPPLARLFGRRLYYMLEGVKLRARLWRGVIYIEGVRHADSD